MLQFGANLLEGRSILTSTAVIPSISGLKTAYSSIESILDLIWADIGLFLDFEDVGNHSEQFPERECSILEAMLDDFDDLPWSDAIERVLLHGGFYGTQGWIVTVILDALRSFDTVHGYFRLMSL